MDELLKAKQNDTFFFPFIRKNARGSVVDLTDYVVASQLRSSTDVVVLTGLVLDGPNGVGLLTLPHNETGSVKAGSYACDVEFSKNGFVVSSQSFNVKILPDVTIPIDPVPAPGNWIDVLPSFSPENLPPLFAITMMDGGSIAFYPSQTLSLNGIAEQLMTDGLLLEWNGEPLMFTAL